MIKRINPKDYSIRPFKAYKQWELNQGSLGIKVYRGEQVTGSYFDSGSEPTSNGVPKRSIFDQINQLYYKNQNPLTMFGQSGRFEDNIRTIHTYCNVLSIPTRYYGEEIRSGSVVITDDVTGKTYRDDGKGNLIDAATSSVQVGNVIYPHGLIISTNTSSFYSESFTGNYDLKFRSTITHYEHEIFISVERTEFNVSTNPTAYVSDTGSIFHGFIRKTGIYESASAGEVYYDLNYTSSYSASKGGGFGDYDFSSSIDPTGSYLAPFITTIGMYDDDLNLVAYGKLAKPVKSLPDLPINFIIRMDL